MALLALGASLLLGGAARAGPITGIVSFGDSLSDVGNDYLGSGGVQPAPAADYYHGHFSNGPIWLEYLAKDLGIAAPTPALAGGTDYAFGGAQTGPGFSTFAGAQVRTSIPRSACTSPRTRRMPLSSSPSGEEPMTPSTAARPIR